jgi:alpha-ketoglutarate-dependent 2,4-dichlorophenoxyacetate dioxygenase
MAIALQKLHPLFVAEVTSSVELRNVVDEETLSQIRAGMDEFAVLVFHNQPFTDEEQLAFAERLDGKLNRVRVLANNRLGNDALIDISNVDESGEVMDTYNRRRMYNLGNRLWHTDASFNEPRGRYSMLHARVVPPVPADTEFADLRSAYDTLPDDTKIQIADPSAPLGDAFCKTLGFEDFSPEEAARLEGSAPLVHTIGLGPQVVLRCFPRITHRLAGTRRAFAAVGIKRPRHSGALSLRPRLVRRRPRDLG